MSDTPITDAALNQMPGELKADHFIRASDMRKLELAANGLRERLTARQWEQYMDGEGEVWAQCSDCLRSPEEGHAPNCETAAALAAFAALQPSPMTRREPHE